MKQFLLPCALLIFGSALAQTPLLEEDFESYDNGSYIGESSSVWSTWSGTTGGDEDGIITDEFANSGIVVEINIEKDIPKYSQHGVLKGLEFQKDLEKLAFNAGGRS